VIIVYIIRVIEVDNEHEFIPHHFELVSDTYIKLYNRITRKAKQQNEGGGVETRYKLIF